MRAMILAAGEGRRLRPLTDRTPKPMIDIAGRPLLDYNLALLKRHGIREIAINVSHLADVIREHLETRHADLDVRISVERELLGTAGGVKKMASFLTDPFVVLYGDVLTDLDLTSVVAFHARLDAAATICLHEAPRDRPSSSVVFLDASDRIERFVERPGADVAQEIGGDRRLVNSGIYVLRKAALDHVPDGAHADFARDVFPAMLERGEALYGFVHRDCFWAEIGRREKLRALREILKKGEAGLDL